MEAVKKGNIADNLRVRETSIKDTPKTKESLEIFSDKRYISSEGIRNPEPIDAGNNSQSGTASGGGNIKDERGGGGGNTTNIAN